MTDEEQEAMSEQYLTALKSGTFAFRLHDMEENVIVLVDTWGHGAEFCNTLNSFGDQNVNIHFILAAIQAYVKENQS